MIYLGQVGLEFSGFVVVVQRAISITLCLPCAATGNVAPSIVGFDRDSIVIIAERTLPIASSLAFLGANERNGLRNCSRVFFIDAVTRCVLIRLPCFAPPSLLHKDVTEHIIIQGGLRSGVDCLVKQFQSQLSFAIVESDYRR